MANAGLLLPVTLAQHLGLRELVDNHVDLGGAPGRANAGDKFLTLVASALAGGDCIDDADALRAGGVWAGAGRCDQGTVHAGLSRAATRKRLPQLNHIVFVDFANVNRIGVPVLLAWLGNRPASS